MENSTNLEIDLQDIPEPYVKMSDLTRFKEGLLLEISNTIKFNHDELYRVLIEERRERNEQIKKKLIIAGKILALFNAGGLSWTFFINLFL
jgi:hypothetical protein